MSVFHPFETSGSGSVHPPDAELLSNVNRYHELYKAICENRVEDVINILDNEALDAPITSSGKRPLHVAALFGHKQIVERLLQFLPREFLETVDDLGNTALSFASITGNKEVAELLVEKNPRTLLIPNSTDELPVTLAFLNGHPEMGSYLYGETPQEFLTQHDGHHGHKLLYSCLETQCFDIVLQLLQRHRTLLSKRKEKISRGEDSSSSEPLYEIWSPIYKIATMKSAIPSQGIPQIHPIMKVIPQIHRIIKVMRDGQLRLHGQNECVLGLHEQVNDIISLICVNAKENGELGVLAKALFLAVEKGNVEFVFHVSKEIPEILLFGDKSLQNIFFYAVKHRQSGVFNMIHGLRFKQVVVTSKDKDGNTLLHMAARKAPDPVLNRIYGATLQMQRELQWFKEVQSLMPPAFTEARNNDGMTAEELFRESHKELMKQGEEWIKATASSCSVVGTLIVTIMFAAAFTVPGGNDQNFGYPLLIKQPFFKVFIFSTISSFISSSSSVLMFLAILTSRYFEDKFLKSLPTKLILGLFLLFISIVTMIIAFLSAIRLILKHTNYSWSLIPITGVACVPVILFVLLEFPLLLHSALSTYQNVFNRKVKLWP